MNKTFELTIKFPHSQEGSQTKETVISWLQEKGIDSFVEGVIDNLDLDHEYGLPEPDFYTEQGGSFSPIILCSFDEAYISDLKSQLSKIFSSQIELVQIAMDTESWQNGWKDSFQPIVTDLFRIVPPWESALPEDSKHTIFIEPGMAFGTGQHASTQVCLQAIESLAKQNFDFSKISIIDVGTGSGILAIALAKLGAQNLWASDIDKDSMVGAKLNAAQNHVLFQIFEGTLPKDQSFDLIVANILYKVLAPLLPQFCSALNKKGKILLSGLVEEQAASMIQIAKENGFRLENKESKDGWVSLLFGIS